MSVAAKSWRVFIPNKNTDRFVSLSHVCFFPELSHRVLPPFRSSCSSSRRFASARLFACSRPLHVPSYHRDSFQQSIRLCRVYPVLPPSFALSSIGKPHDAQPVHPGEDGTLHFKCTPEVVVNQRDTYINSVLLHARTFFARDRHGECAKASLYLIKRRRAARFRAFYSLIARAAY